MSKLNAPISLNRRSDFAPSDLIREDYETLKFIAPSFGFSGISSSSSVTGTVILRSILLLWSAVLQPVTEDRRLSAKLQLNNRSSRSQFLNFSVIFPSYFL